MLSQTHRPSNATKPAGLLLAAALLLTSGCATQADTSANKERIEALTKRVEALENLSFSRSVAEMEIQARLQGKDIPPVVAEFLAQQWLKLLPPFRLPPNVQLSATGAGVVALDTLPLVW